MRKLLNIKRLGFNFRKKVARFFFLKMTEYTDLKEKMRCKKISNFKPFFYSKNTQSKYTLYTTAQANSY